MSPARVAVLLVVSQRLSVTAAAAEYVLALTTGSDTTGSTPRAK
jgi:hypothetical protein